MKERDKGASLIDDEKRLAEQCCFDNYVIGEMDTSGREIEQVAFYEKSTYIIYFVKGDYLKAYYVDAYEFKAFFPERFQQLVGEIRSMNVKNEESNKFVRQGFASAYYNALNGYREVAVGELMNLKNRLLYRSYIKWLTTYLVCNLLLIFGCSIVIYMAGGKWVSEMSYCITSSCVGSFLTYTKQENDKVTEHYLPVIDAMITFFASCISGFLVYCVLKSNLLLGAFNENIYGMMIVCFVAGFNEDIPLKLLKNLTSMVENTKIKAKKV